MSDDDALNELLSKPSSKSRSNCGSNIISKDAMGSPAETNEQDDDLSGLVQWTTNDGKRFIPASHTAKKITPGVYEIQTSPVIGIYFQKIPVITQGLLRFPQTNSDKVVSEIQKFWEREKIFQEYRITHKRGIMLYGPPGGGKTSLIQLIMQDVVERNGVVVKFTHPQLFNDGMRKFREIEPSTPVVVLMEDIDSIIQNYNESDVLNILDGVNQIEKVVFLATTNYPELLGARIINRPSRFDKRFCIKHPNAESRRLYFRHIIGDEKIAELKLNLDKWIEDTDEFSIAHLKELFTAVIILGDKYDEAIKTLQAMREENITSANDEARRLGFGNSKKSNPYGDSNGY